MIQSVLIFSLGFLAAVLLALLVAPAIWRRAVFLTRKRIESALPLSINELNAEKDMLRAQNAIALRRVEMQVKSLREENVARKALTEEQNAKIHDLEKKLAGSEAEGERLKGEVASLVQRVHELTTELSDVSVALESTRTELEIRTDELKSAKGETADRERELEARSQDISNLELRISALQAEIAERDIRIGELNEDVAGLKEVRRDLQREIRELGAEGRATGSTLAAERKRFAQIEAKLEQSISQVSTLEEKLERRSKELQRSREENDSLRIALRDLEQRAEAAERQNEAHESQIAEMTIRIDRLMSASEEENGNEDSMGELQLKLAQQSVAIRSLELERDQLKRELAAAKADGDSGNGDTVLRDKLNQLAAEVVAMAARLEGPQSRINALLAEDDSTSAGEVVSLADRIKALQRAVDVQRNSA
ncbi:hypothetical protein [Oricola thermophila]|uniref:Uncharacterized protein n=1 Tax=Oricola thermophila TaxID=2742145 RepID=A0A6N1V976_9HYPH|nr:hypothetical protein [Oricola thermophila]QKV17063.1 hypothetical protein HTY61_00565 [Oricola thermophila]